MHSLINTFGCQLAFIYELEQKRHVELHTVEMAGHQVGILVFNRKHKIGVMSENKDRFAWIDVCECFINPAFFAAKIIDTNNLKVINKCRLIDKDFYARAFKDSDKLIKISEV
ncbi:hypothetical protein D3C73_1063090 [compost metagenome]